MPTHVTGLVPLRRRRQRTRRTVDLVEPCQNGDALILYRASQSWHGYFFSILVVHSILQCKEPPTYLEFVP
jgi:hypothetical protein